jgi:sugar lactone lactonase YvrE
MEGQVTVLTSTCGGSPLVFTDDLDVASDGTIYFSDASVRFSQKHWKLDIVESRPNGRLCAYDPRAKETREVLRDLYFANGVALDPSGEFVLVNETSRYRVRKLFIAGPRKGEHEIVIENLPGFPDNLSSGAGGLFWIAIASPRNRIVDALAGAPFLRKVILRLPEAIQPKPEHTARAIAIDASGRVRFDFFDPTGTPIFMITSVEERGGWLYFGSLQDEAVARMRSPDQGGGV